PAGRRIRCRRAAALPGRVTAEPHRGVTMPTYYDPVADAGDSRESVRALAHASRAFRDPADTYRVIGELLATLRSLEQVLEQVAAAHVRDRGGAFLDNGDRSGGLIEADTAAH